MQKRRLDTRKWPHNINEFLALRTWRLKRRLCYIHDFMARVKGNERSRQKQKAARFALDKAENDRAAVLFSG